MKFKTNILVRDKRIEEMESVGILVDYKKLSQKEYIKALRKKIIEETLKMQKEEHRSIILGKLKEIPMVTL